MSYQVKSAKAMYIYSKLRILKNQFTLKRNKQTNMLLLTVATSVLKKEQVKKKTLTNHNKNEDDQEGVVSPISTSRLPRP